MNSLNKHSNEYLLAFERFSEDLEKRNSNQIMKDRLQHLAGIKKEQYAMVLTFEDVNGVEALLEHEQYNKFAKTTNRYMYHPENSNIPVKAHYHIYPAKGKKELYAVNVDDGSAHHKINRGYLVPKKEAEELRSIGVNLSPNNILEAIDYTLNENIEGEYLTVYVIVDIAQERA